MVEPEETGIPTQRYGKTTSHMQLTYLLRNLSPQANYTMGNVRQCFVSLAT